MKRLDKDEEVLEITPNAKVEIVSFLVGLTYKPLFGLRTIAACSTWADSWKPLALKEDVVASFPGVYPEESEFDFLFFLSPWSLENCACCYLLGGSLAINHLAFAISSIPQVQTRPSDGLRLPARTSSVNLSDLVTNTWHFLSTVSPAIRYW